MKRVGATAAASYPDICIRDYKEAAMKSRLLLRLSTTLAMEIHSVIRAIDEFFYSKLSTMLDPNIEMDDPHQRQKHEEPEKERLSTNDDEYVREVIDNCNEMLEKDPFAYTTTLPSNSTNWSLAMLTWLMIGKATILVHKLYRLHPIYRVHRLRDKHSSANCSCSFAFLHISAKARDKDTHNLPENLDVNTFGGLPRFSPFNTKYMPSMSDSEYLCACGAVSSSKPIMCLTLTELMTQIKVLHCAWAETLRPHVDLTTALTLLEMRAFLLASFSWWSDVLDIPPMEISYNLATGGHNSSDTLVFSLTREVQGNTTPHKRITSHRFAYEMQTFFMTTRMHLNLHSRYQHVGVNILNIPQWNADPKERGRCWKRFTKEIELGHPSLLADIAKDSMANLYKIVKYRPCEKELYNKALKLPSDTPPPVSQVWYEFRPGSSVNRVGISFSSNWIKYNAEAEDTVPNPSFRWKEMRPVSSNRDTNVPLIFARTISRHTVVRNVMQCKLGGVLVNSYIQAASPTADLINWERNFFVTANDVIWDINSKLEPTGKNVMPKIVYLMNDYYIYVKLSVDGTSKSYFIDTPDMMTAIYVWIFLIFQYYGSKLYDTYDLSMLTHRIFSNGKGKNFTSKAMYKGISMITKSDETIELMAALS